MPTDKEIKGETLNLEQVKGLSERDLQALRDVAVICGLTGDAMLAAGELGVRADKDKTIDSKKP